MRINMDPGMLRAFEKRAKENGTTAAEVVRGLVMEYLGVDPFENVKRKPFRRGLEEAFPGARLVSSQH